MSVVADKLREARTLIERGWTQNSYARGKRGEVKYDSRHAICYCAVGALARANHQYPNATMAGIDFLDDVIGARREDEAAILIWNDKPERTQAEVLAAFDKAIELAEAQQ